MPERQLPAPALAIALLACGLLSVACSDRTARARTVPNLDAASTVQQFFLEDSPEPFVQEEAFRLWKEELLDWLERTGPVVTVQPEPAEPMIGLGRTIVDATLEHPGGAQSTISAQLEQDPQGGWKIVWLRGPAGSWPPR